MGRLQFDVKYRPQIESGEYKVKTKDGKQVRIVSWDKEGFECQEIVALVTNATGTESCNIYTINGFLRSNYYQRNMNLFIITPEEELDVFEEGLNAFLFDFVHTTIDEDPIKYVKKNSGVLLSFARQKLIKDGYIIEKKAFHDAVKKVDPEVMKKVSENIDNTERTEFEGRLVKFYNDSNSLTCDKDGVFNRHERDELLHNTASELLSLARKEFAKEYKGGSEANEKTISAYCSGYEAGKADAFKDIDGTAKVHCKSYDNGYDCGKKEALKDLPRWKKIGQGNNYSSETEFCINGRYLEMNDTWNYLYEISLKDLEKLPKEDEE